jgi:hypothetical protein
VPAARGRRSRASRWEMRGSKAGRSGPRPAGYAASHSADGGPHTQAAVVTKSRQPARSADGDHSLAADRAGQHIGRRRPPRPEGMPRENRRRNRQGTQHFFPLAPPPALAPPRLVPGLRWGGVRPQGREAGRGGLDLRPARFRRAGRVGLVVATPLKAGAVAPLNREAHHVPIPCTARTPRAAGAAVRDPQLPCPPAIRPSLRPQFPPVAGVAGGPTGAGHLRGQQLTGSGRARPCPERRWCTSCSRLRQSSDCDGAAPGGGRCAAQAHTVSSPAPGSPPEN